MAAIQSGIPVANAATSLAIAATGGLKAVLKQMRRAATSDPAWISVESGEGTNATFTADEVRDVEQFLSSERVRPILSLTAIGRLSTSDNGEADASTFLSDVEVGFRNEAERWFIESNSNWRDRLDVVWKRVNDIFDRALPKEFLGLEPEIAAYENFLNSPFAATKSEEKVKQTYLTELNAVAQDVDRLISAYETSEHLAELIGTATQEPIVSHTKTRVNPDFRSLYVPREVADITTGKKFKADALLSPAAPYRVVIMGPPGVGKSTIVNHLRMRFAEGVDDAAPTPMVILRCKDYFAQHWDGSITDYLKKRLGVDLSRDISSSVLESMLLLGRIAIVFDGLDEISERAMRTSMVQRIQAFTVQHPATSVLITTREVGYESARLKSDLFQHIRLLEFETDDIQYYCEQWFRLADQCQLTKPFLRESESVSDLRSNPLLLSLLCILYRGSGAIPRDRRSIYMKCANLFFHDWDQSRHILQHELMAPHGDLLMQEIASNFEAWGRTQRPTDEDSIAQAIIAYMVDEMSLQFEQAESAAWSFLAFCTERAWLLRDAGPNENNHRTLEFVHQTFYEFFSAEYVAAHAVSDKDVADQILGVFKENPTSVFPELLIQSYDMRRAGQANQVVALICIAQPSSALLLRLLDACKLRPASIATVVSILVSRWLGTLPGPTKSSVVASSGQAWFSPFRDLLALPAIARRRFFDDLLMIPSEPDLRVAFIQDWFEIVSGIDDDPLHVEYQFDRSRGSEDNLYPAWKTLVEEMLSHHEEELRRADNPEVVQYLLLCGFRPNPSPEPWNYMVYQARRGLRTGYVWECIYNVIQRDLALPSNADEPIRIIHSMLASGVHIPDMVIDYLRDTYFSKPLDWPSRKIRSQEEGWLRDILAIVALASTERDMDHVAILLEIEHLYSGSLSQLAQARAANVAGQSGSSHAINDRVEAVLADLPEICRRWLNLERSFLEQSPAEDV